ncbi:hypothetical protein C8R44DRAFT_751325 [Mycena epipterygia]|nr:hypothetical protein C8R44DRAFT_751325 [Mycena epipterygia]
MNCAVWESKSTARHLARPRIYPSPSSSPEGIHAVAQSAPPALRAQAVSSGLHTPAASVDLTPPSSEAPSTIPCLDIRGEIWLDLSEAIVNERQFKVTYDSGTQLLTVTWTTDVHEGFKWAIQPLIHATEKNKTYIFETDIRIQFHQGEYNTMAPTPDLAFGKHASEGKQEYPIILESGFSQTPHSLETVAQMHLTQPKVIETLPDVLRPVGCLQTSQTLKPPPLCI